MKRINNYIRIVIEFFKRVWPSVKIFIKTVAPII
jgi:hypothetical protein